jgi:urea transporter
MTKTLREFYPTLVALALALSLAIDGSLFIMTMAAAIATLPLAYAPDVDEIARRVRAANNETPADAPGTTDAPGPQD